MLPGDKMATTVANGRQRTRDGRRMDSREAGQTMGDEVITSPRQRAGFLRLIHRIQTQCPWKHSCRQECQYLVCRPIFPLLWVFVGGGNEGIVAVETLIPRASVPGAWHALMSMVVKPLPLSRQGFNIAKVSSAPTCVSLPALHHDFFSMDKTSCSSTSYLRICPTWLMLLLTSTEYNPEDPISTLQAMQNFMSQFPMNFMNADSGRGRNNRRGGRSGKRGGGRAPFSAEGPVLDRSKSTIVVESIPEENFSEEEVKGFFSQFGNILEVTLQPYKRLAIVKFDAWAAANAAYKSHKAIFDNRFVKVYWYKDDQDAPKQAGANGHRKGDDEVNADAMETEADADAEPEMDPEEFRQRQEEAQQKFLEQEKKKAEIQRQREELEQQQKELLDKHRQAMELLKSKLAEKNGGTGDSAAPPTSAEALRAKLADLESEAKMLGIDPDETDMMPASSFPPGRGGHYGYRGRGGFPPRGRGSRGAARGRFGGTDGRHAAYAQYSLDNRPKRLAITGVDFSVPEKDEGLRHFLLVSRSRTGIFISFCCSH